MIIDKYNCIYTNIPKTGSRSIKEYFKLNEDHFPLYKEMIKNEEKFKTYFKFSFVRNPWDRLLSAFAYLSKGGVSNYDKLSREKYIVPCNFDFDKFVLSLNRNTIWEQVHLIPQYYWICQEKSTNILTDYVGYFENFDQDWAFIHKKLNLEPRIEPYFFMLKNKAKGGEFYKRLSSIKIAKKIVHKFNTSQIIRKIGIKTTELPHVNKSKHKHYTEYYNENTQKHVEYLYSEDIEMFNYCFEGKRNI